MTPEAVRSRLWSDAGDDGHVYAILDGGRNENLLDILYADDAPSFACLFAGDLEPDMAEVAPYLVELVEGTPFCDWLLDKGWGDAWGVFLTSRLEMAPLWRHLRQLTLVYDPELNPVYFRFYDPRVLNGFLPISDEKQLADFFGAVDTYIVEGEGGKSAKAFSLAEGKLVAEAIDTQRR